MKLLVFLTFILGSPVTIGCSTGIISFEVPGPVKANRHGHFHRVEGLNKMGICWFKKWTIKEVYHCVGSEIFISVEGMRHSSKHNYVLGDELED